MRTAPPKLWYFPFVAAMLALMAFCARQGHAHDWYSSTSDPVYQSSCCGGHDCAPVDPAWVSDTAEGYRLRMTIEQAKTVNPSADAPVDAIRALVARAEPADGRSRLLCLHLRS
jgi:hypothetical protein